MINYALPIILKNKIYYKKHNNENKKNIYFEVSGK